MNPFPGKVVLGITGGIACGKSTVCDKFSNFDWEVISTDACTHYLLANDQDLLQEIEDRWGHVVIDEKGNIDKVQLARLVFSSSVERTWLEGLLHPKVRKRWINMIDVSSRSRFVVEIPLLFENNLNAYFTNSLSI